MSKIKQHLNEKYTSVYLDCAATTPIEPAVRDVLLRYLEEDFGNAGSRTHEYGARAKQAVQKARDQVAAVAGCQREEVIFTSGATEANNLALLGLKEHGERTGRRHIISSQIEHKAVLEPLEELERCGFTVDLLRPSAGGWVEPGSVAAALRPDTLLVSIMHANNETGILQPIDDIVEALGTHEAFFHVDAAQTFGKELAALRNFRIDLISASAHKIFGPKGIGALVARKRGFERPPLRPLVFGGGQERGLRPGTLPVPLIVAFGMACESAVKNAGARKAACVEYRDSVLKNLEVLSPELHGDPSRSLPHIVNLTIPGIDSEAVMVATKEFIAISNGSACTSSSYSQSHVLTSMGLTELQVAGAIRISWCHMTPEPDWGELVSRLQAMQ